MPRGDRVHETPAGIREPGQRDHDRILYSSAFRRLSGVTQVVIPRGEPYLFHNRLTHSLKVAQVGRRIAEALLYKAEVAQDECDPDVVEAACLAHDLGHPPFGHVAEWQLCESVLRKAPDSSGFEGNAQTFRILTRLAARKQGIPGLDLCRATLAATIKYPWPRGGNPDLPDKWGFYEEDREDFEWALAEVGGAKTLEAELMDWADDIAYAVHDLEDFYRAGFIPLERLASGDSLDEVYGEVVEGWRSHLEPEPPEPAELAGLNARFELFPLTQPFTGARTDRAAVRAFLAALVNDLVTSTHMQGGTLRPDRPAVLLVSVLKQLTRRYVINSPLLGTQQRGHRQIVKALFDIYFDVLEDADDPEAVHQLRWNEVLPQRWIEEGSDYVGTAAADRARCAADIIAGMTEEEAYTMHHRLTGIGPGAFLDPVVS